MCPAALLDYKAKYESGETEYIVRPVSLEIMRLLKETALKAHNLLGCAFFSRVDIILDKTNKPFVLEVNIYPASPLPAFCQGGLSQRDSFS